MAAPSATLTGALVGEAAGAGALAAVSSSSGSRSTPRGPATRHRSLSPVAWTRRRAVTAGASSVGAGGINEHDSRRQQGTAAMKGGGDIVRSLSRRGVTRPASHGSSPSSHMTPQRTRTIGSRSTTVCTAYGQDDGEQGDVIFNFDNPSSPSSAPGESGEGAGAGAGAGGAAAAGGADASDGDIMASVAARVKAARELAKRLASKEEDMAEASALAAAQQAQASSAVDAPSPAGVTPPVPPQPYEYPGQEAATAPPPSMLSLIHI